jgi:hypothetical protein
MNTFKDNWDKVSMVFAALSIISYWFVLSHPLIGVIIAVVNSCFWLAYFVHKDVYAQVLIHISYQIASIIFLINHFGGFK